MARLLAACWVGALAVHLAWVPNAVWFMMAQAAASGDAVAVEVVAWSRRAELPPVAGLGATGRREPEAEQAGAAPGGSAAARARDRSEWRRSARDQATSEAQRAPDLAETPRPHRPDRRGRTSAPARGVALAAPGVEDISMRGTVAVDASVLSRRGASRDGPTDVAPGGGGRPSDGDRAPQGEGELSAASAGRGPGQRPEQARRGARPRQASPAVPQGAPTADARPRGPLAGLEPSRQAAPELAWSSAPVREPRRASGAEARSDVVAGGPVARRRAQGDGAEAHGPGDGGRGRGTAGAGSAQNALYNDYLRDSMSRIQRHWSFPRELIYALRQGIVYLVVRVAPDGRIRRVTVRRSSGYEQFDAYAIRAVREANPLAPPPPQELFRRGSSYLDLPLEMRYRNPMFE